MHKPGKLESAFLAQLHSLDAPPEKSSIRKSGLRKFFWASPCKQVEGLWAVIHEPVDEGDRPGIMLSTAITHIHVDASHFAWQTTGPWGAGDVARLAAKKAASILAGEIVFNRTYGVSGPTGSSGMGPRETFAMGHESAKQCLQEGEYVRYWNWFGEISAPQ